MTSVTPGQAGHCHTEEQLPNRIDPLGGWSVALHNPHQTPYF